MNIDRLDVVRKLGGSVEGTPEMKVSLFVVSQKSPRLKMLDLGAKNLQERAEKLHKWAEGHRLVAVIESGDQVFAHVNQKFAEQLKEHQDLSINGKKVTVESLSDEEYEQLALVDAAFEEYVNQSSEPEEHKDLEELTSSSRSAVREYLATHQLLSDQIFIAHLLTRMENLSNEIILNCLRKMTESRREVEARRKEDQKKHDILVDEIERTILKGEIVKGEVQRQELKADATRVNRARGG